MEQPMDWYSRGTRASAYVQSRLSVASSAVAPASRLDANGVPVDEYRQRSRTQSAEIRNRAIQADIAKREKQIEAEKKKKNRMSFALAMILLGAELLAFSVICLSNAGTIRTLKANYATIQSEIQNTKKSNASIQREIEAATDVVNICSAARDIGLHRRQDSDIIVVDAPGLNQGISTIASSN